MNVTQNGVVIGKIGLCMKKVGRCKTCKKSRSLMYAVFHPEDSSLKPKAPTCSQCTHNDEMFVGILANLPKRMIWH